MNRNEYNNAVKLYSSRLFTFIVKNINDTSKADDIVQDTFEKLWINRKKVELDSARQWLFTTGYRIMINQIKKSQKQTSFGDYSQAYESRQGSQHQFEIKEYIEKAINQLPEIQKTIVLLRDMEGYDYKEIGEMINLTDSQVKVYLFRARKKLKSKLKNLLNLVA